MNEPSTTERRWSATTAKGALEIGREWLMSPALRTLLAALGGPVPMGLDRDLQELVEWSARTLDTRKGEERQIAKPVALSDSSVAVLIDAAGPLGLLNTPPPSLATYDITVVLGGTTTGNELRTRLAADLAAAKTDIGQVVGLAAERPLNSTECDAHEHRTESEHLKVVLMATFNQPIGGILGRVEYGETEDRESIGAEPVRMLTAPSSRPGLRADTEDTVRCLAKELPSASRERVLVITSAIYASYQFLVVAPILLSQGSQYVEVVGTPTATDGSRSVLAQRIAQEIHGTIVTIARQFSPSPET